MADIRINALTSTAATTALDDYFAVDGSSNGTRKLSAFSPTLGGNLTVTGTAAISGGLTLGSGSGAIAEYLNRGTTAQSNLVQWQTAGSANWSVGSGATGTGTDLEFYNHNTASSNLKLNYSTGAATLTGNLTVAGGTARFQDPTNSYGVTITTAAAKTLVETLFGGSSLGIRVGGSGSDSLTIASTGATIRDNLTVSGGTTTLADSNGSFGTITGSYNAGNPFVRFNRIGATESVGFYADNSTRFVNNNAETARFFANGNLFVGASPVDSANGKIQLATHTTSAGGIGPSH